MEALQIIAPIVVGGIIGYCTNYIAIKMLFRPRKEICFGTWKLPFTPGVIPKNQKRIARAVGNAVSERLITKQDMADRLKESKVKARFVGSVTDLLFDSESGLNRQPLKDYLESSSVEEVSERITEEVIREVNQADFVPVIREVGNEALKDYLQNPMIAMFLNGAILESIYMKIESSIKTYVNDSGKETIQRLIQNKGSELLEGSACDVLDTCGVPERMVTGILEKVFDSFAESCVSGLVEQLDVRGIVIEKIEAMHVDELEALVMSVMKQELNAVINLGAVIGAVIGILNVFI